MANSGLTEAARKDYNQQINAIREAAIREGVDTIINVVECGVDASQFGVPSGLRRAVVNSSIVAVRTLDQYMARGGSTPLYDAIGLLIDDLRKVPDANENHVSFLIVVLTDGGENASQTYRYTIKQMIANAQATGRWTFALRMPRNYGRSIANTLGIPVENINEWEQTERDLERSTHETQTAYNGYFQAKALAGVQPMNSRSFFTANLAGLDKTAIKKALVDVTSQVKFFDVGAQDNKRQIKQFLEEKAGHAPLGAGFYQLAKKEEVQDHKLIAVRDKRTGKVYSGVEARNILGLPSIGSIKLSPGDHGEFDIFVQSKSVNRNLVGGTQVMFWNNVGAPR
ncbi:MAG TPA: hypothetical protein VFA39_15455 [Steroidobacteraceae bacterium]|nr:hypothetical protein [Steroidobacteraceae bacterium]